MVVELTRDEAEILIAVLTYAEGAALCMMNESITSALKALRPWRSALLGAYIKARTEGTA